MKIAFLVDQFPCVSETFILNQITGLLDMGQEVEIFAKERRIGSRLHNDINKYNLLKKVHYYEKIPAERISSSFRTMVLFIKNVFKDPIRLIKSLYIFKNNKYGRYLGRYFFSIPFVGKDFDILQCHYGMNGNIGAFLKQAGFRYKIVTMFHGYDIRLGEQNGPGIYSPLNKFGDCFLAISEMNFKALEGFGFKKEKIIFHPVGIEINKYMLQEKDIAVNRKTRVVVITVARLVEEKGIQYAIEAIWKVMQENPHLNLEYQIIGDGPKKDFLQELAASFGLEHYIAFLGEMDQDSVIKKLMSADIFLLTSIAEVLPVVLMEAHAAGLPVVATDVGSISQIVQDGKTGFIVPVGNVDAIKNKIEYLIKHPEKGLEMGKHGRAIVESKYNITSLNKKLVNLYTELLNA